MPTGQDYKFAFNWLIFVLVFVGLIGLAALFFANLGSAAQVISVDNIRRLSQQANQMEQQLDTLYDAYLAQKESVDSYVALYGEDQSKWPQGKDEEYLQSKNHMRNAKIAYDTLCNELQALYNDEWRSLPVPKDISTRCELD